MQAALWQSENLQRPHKKWWHIQISSNPSGTRGQRWCQPQHHLYSMRHAIESRWSIYDIQLLSECNGKHEDWDTYVGTHKEGYMGSNQRDKISSLIDRQLIAIPRLPFKRWFQLWNLVRYDGQRSCFDFCLGKPQGSCTLKSDKLRYGHVTELQRSSSGRRLRGVLFRKFCSNVVQGCDNRFLIFVFIAECLLKFSDYL